MTMRAESGARRNAVFVDHTQGTETHVRRIPILGKGKAVPGIKPAMLRMATLARSANLDHGVVFQKSDNSAGIRRTGDNAEVCTAKPPSCSVTFRCQVEIF
jgi:hypothetical protein